MKKNRIVLFILIMHSCLNYSQDKIIPVSPEAAALAKIVNYPINYNTGVPNINIPFYEVTVGDLKLPITLDYHAGGFKINEQSTRVGLGWSLSCDLQITRSINGIDDFALGGYINNVLVKGFDPSIGSYNLYPFESSHYNTLTNSYDNDNYNAYNLATGSADAMPDTFYYKLLNKSGSFYYQKNSVGTGGSFVSVPYDNIKITFQNGAFTIIDTDGTRYSFGEEGVVGSSQETLATDKREYTGPDGNKQLTTWKCSTIESNNTFNNITFKYENKTPVEHIIYNDKIEFFTNTQQCFGNPPQHFASNMPPLNNDEMSYEDIFDYSSLSFYNISSPKYINYFANKTELHIPYIDTDGSSNVVDKIYTYKKPSPASKTITNVYGISLSEINFRGGRVVFSGVNSNGTVNNGADQLNSIKVLDDNGIEVKSLQLYQSFSIPTTTQYLDSLHVKNGVNTFQRYAMLYNLDSNFNYRKFAYGNQLKGHDAWGYPNKSTRDLNNTNLPDSLAIPKKIINIEHFATSCSASVANKKIAIGSDNYWSEEVDENVAKQGILKRIIYPTGGALDFDFENNKYRDTDASSKFHSIPRLAGGLRIRSINFLDENSKLVKQKYYRYGDYEEGTGTLLLSPPRISSVLGQSGNPQEQHSLDTQSYVQNIYYGRISCPLCNYIPAATEQKTTYQPTSALDFTYASGAPIYYTKVTEYEQDLSKETGKTVYSYFDPKMFCGSDLPIEQNIIPGTNIPYIRTGWMMGEQKGVDIYKYDIQAGYKPIHKKSFQYVRENLGQVNVAYSFFKNIYNADGDIIELYNKTGTSNNFIYGQYSIPVGKLLLTQENNEWYETSGVKKDSTIYIYTSSLIHPSVVQTADSFGNTISTNTKYTYDFSGVSPYNLMAGKNMIEQPIEEIKTKTYANTTTNIEISRKKINYDLFNARFYAPTSIQSSVKGAPLVTDITFDKYDDFGNVLQTRAKNGVPTSYLWGYNNKYPVAKLENVTYYDPKLTPFIYNNSITNPTSPTDFLLLRNAFNLPGQFISTYTYKKQVGLTSSTLPNGVSQYYDYDPIGRLTTQSDTNHNILKTNEYQVNNTTKNCFPLSLQYYSVPMMLSSGYDCTTGLLNNYIQKGGAYISSGYNADSEMGLTVIPDFLPTNCESNPTNVATIEMRYTYYSMGSGDYPEKMYVDFIQNESIVATQILKPSPGQNDPPTGKLLLPEGDYIISFRMSANIKYKTPVKFYLIDGTKYTDFNIGDTFTFNKGKNYTIRGYF